jgi:hypothetical protein
MATAPRPPKPPAAKRSPEHRDRAHDYFRSMLSGPYAATILTSTDPDAIASAVRLSFKCAEVFMEVSS